MTEIVYKEEPNLEKANVSIVAATEITTPLAGSPSQNTPKRLEVSKLLREAAEHLSTLIAALEQLEWEEEAGVFAKTAAFIKNISEQATTKKELSWADLDNNLKKIQETLANNKAGLATRTKNESEALVQAVKDKVEEFAPDKATGLTEKDWEHITSTTKLSKDSSKKSESFPLALLEPWRASTEIEEVMEDFDTTVSEHSGSLANNVESVTVKLGLERHKGRKLAFQARKHKWVILGIIAVLLFLMSKRRKKPE